MDGMICNTHLGLEIHVILLAAPGSPLPISATAKELTVRHLVLVAVAVSHPPRSCPLCSHRVELDPAVMQRLPPWEVFVTPVHRGAGRLRTELLSDLLAVEQLSQPRALASTFCASASIGHPDNVGNLVREVVEHGLAGHPLSVLLLHLLGLLLAQGYSGHHVLLYSGTSLKTLALLY